MKKTLGWIGIFLLFVIVTAFSYVKFVLPDVGEAPDLKIEITTERVARGDYLANHVAICMDCHSTRDWSKFSGPPIEGTLGMGGEKFDQKMGFPGTYYASNITPEGIARYTDGELFRIITTGVNKEGKAIFPVMPYEHYSQMDKEDINSIIAYIRSLKPIKNDVPESSSDFPMNLIINTIPKEADLSVLPNKDNIVNYGKYLTNAAACIECHSQAEKGKLIAGSEFGGGREFILADGSMVISKNITPDNKTGLGKWTEDMFIDLFISRSDALALNTKLKTGTVNTIMPWTMYGKMTREDLSAIYAYLKTLKPIENNVQSIAATSMK